ncbi:hypothetical protein NQ317_015538 [Molorchus minor]|uniref:Coiled-coil domain-containing protein 112 n=1 Tax=Molorchus minor TaxID=1323400 RepID=A0ABQ9JN82_9CUCU|nr:hypothetical protein NQ317_015538 [Molorchus minor]
MSVFSIVEVNKLNNVKHNVEKSIELVFEHLKKYPDIDVHQFSLDMEEKRQVEWQHLRLKVEDIIGPLTNKINLIKEKKMDEITDFKQFKKEMIAIQENIQNFKSESKTKYQSLENQVNCISEDIQYYNTRLLDWVEPIKIDEYLNPVRTKIIRNNHRCKETTIFMDFLYKHGGHENGWRKEDHLLFIKFRKMYKNIDLVAKNLHSELPDISIEDIKQHEEWYKTYLDLQAKKKEAIKSWQRARNSKQPVRNSVVSSVRNVIQTEENTREKLIKWKVYEKLRYAKEMQICQEQIKREKEQLKNKRQEELKRVVQEWKQTKQSLEQEEIVQKRMFEEREKKKRSLEANRMIKQYRSQDDIYILKMRQQKKPEVNPQPRSKSSTLAKRDPERLLKPTKQWINRVHGENQHSNGFCSIMDLKRLPKL